MRAAGSTDTRDDRVIGIGGLVAVLRRIRAQVVDVFSEPKSLEGRLTRRIPGQSAGLEPLPAPPSNAIPTLSDSSGIQ